VFTPSKPVNGVRSHSSPKDLPNYFANPEVAARYTKVRPYFHDEVAERIRSFAGVGLLKKALDVGCGSGQSSVALSAISEQVIAIDASVSMLEHAMARANIRYQYGCAEKLEFSAEEFDLVSVGSALHWFDLDCFFAECQKVLVPNGMLAVYNDHFTTHMQDVIACKRWMRTRFAKRFPPPRHGMRDMNEEKAVECGFEVAHRSSFSHLVSFSRAEFIAYLLTCSNTLAAIDSGRETEQSAVDWLDSELAPIVPDGVTGAFIFKCNLWMMRKSCL